MPSRWPAVRAETDPLTRARQLQLSWERLIADGGLGPELPPGATAGLRPTIVESWRRSLATGLDPTDLLAPIEADESEVAERWLEHPLGSLAHVLTARLGQVAEESRSIVVVTDASGLVLHRVGAEWLKERASDMNLVEGARYSEAADGTNGIGTALAAGRAYQVFAFEHFNERHHEWICAGAPVRDPVSGQTVGLIDLSSLWKHAHPRSLELVAAAARTMEQSLLDVRRDQDARLRRRYGDLMTRSTDLLVSRDGYVLAGAGPAQSKALDVPEGGGQVVLDDGSVAMAEPVGRGEAYLLRNGATRHAGPAQVAGLERAEGRARELATEQAALRQVATLVARESSADQLLAAVAEQVARVFDIPHVRVVRYEPEGSVVMAGFSEDGKLDEPFPLGSRWPLGTPGVVAIVRQTGRPARVEDYAHMTGEIAAVVRGAGMRSTVASPIVVEGRLWGAMVVLSPQRDFFAEDTESRLTDFTELVATAIANAESRGALARLVDEQAALRRVAVLVAQQPSPSEVFTAVSEAVGLLLEADLAVLHVFPGDGRATAIAGWSGGGAMLPIGERFPLDGENLAARIFQSGAPARMHSHDEVWKRTATDHARGLGMRSAVGAPVLVEGKLWGALMAATRRVEPWAENAETRIAAFTELVATAIANAESREALSQLADEQAALRRVATLVASGGGSDPVFRAVANEVQALFGGGMSVILRLEDDGTATTLGTHSGLPAAGTRHSVDPDFIIGSVHRTGRAARFETDDPTAEGMPAIVRETGVRSAVASPIVVEGELWGAIGIGSLGRSLPPGTELRLASFTELVATAVANTQARDQVRALADEQAALRRVATLVARGVRPAAIFSAVSDEVGRLFGSQQASVTRFDPPGPEIVIVGVAQSIDEVVTVGTRWGLHDSMASAHVFRTGKSARIDRPAGSSARGPAAGTIDRLDLQSTVASPIVVEGGLWGTITVSSSGEPLPADTEQRLEKFTDLVASAIANADSRSELAASRRRIVAAGDEARRRIERDLHDGIQQRLITLNLQARAMSAHPSEELPRLAAELAEGLKDTSDELRELSRGIHPAILTEAGLRPALRALARRSSTPIEVDVELDRRLPAPVEAAGYYIASEALTNVAKHAQANIVTLAAATDDGVLTLEISDDGIGGADAGRGSGILGLTDRAQALGGGISITSPPGGGTTLTARIPIAT